MPGTVWIDDFDRGLVVTLGGQLIDVVAEESGDTRKQYAINFRDYIVRTDKNGNHTRKDFKVEGPPGFGGMVPVYFVVGHSAFTPKIFPCMVIRRISTDYAPENGGQAWGIEYGVPANGSTIVSVQVGNEIRTGANFVEIKPPADPYNITYEISARARGDSAQGVANRMWQAFSRTADPKGFALKLLDSLLEERGYDAIVEGSVHNLEVLDLTGRGAGWSVTVIVHGELDHLEPYVEPTLVSTPNITMQGA